MAAVDAEWRGGGHPLSTPLRRENICIVAVLTLGGGSSNDDYRGNGNLSRGSVSRGGNFLKPESGKTPAKKGVLALSPFLPSPLPFLFHSSFPTDEIAVNKKRDPRTKKLEIQRYYDITYHRDSSLASVF